MFDSESVLGNITDPQGSLSIGHVGDTECVYLHYKSNQGEREFRVVYTGRQLSSLISSAKKGCELAPNAKPRSTVRLGALPPKPIRLQIVFVAPENKTPLIILRFLGSDWKQDIFVQPEVLLENLQNAQRKAPMPGVVGILDRFGTAIWMVEGQTLEVDDELSHGTGYYGEYVHHSEVPEGTVIRAWPIIDDDKMRVVAFEYAQAWEPGGTADLPQGQSGDDALNNGLVRQSRELHALLSKTMFESGRIDPVWAGKVTITSIVGDFLMSDDKAGHATWTGGGSNPVLKAGIQSLRDGKVSPHDDALYKMISAYYVSHDPVPGESSEDVDDFMTAAWNYARFNAPEMRRLVLNNWFIALRRANKGASAGPAFVTFEEAKAEYKHKLRPTVYSLPPAHPWIKRWQPAKTETPSTESQADEPIEEEKAPQPKPSDPLPELPQVDNAELPIGLGPDGQPLTTIPGSKSSDSSPWNDDLMAGNDQEGRREKKKSPVPLVLVGLLLVGGLVVFMLPKAKTDDPVATPSPIASVSASPTPQKTAQPKPTKPTPQPVVIAEGALPEGELLVNGFSLKGKLKERDIASAGYELFESYNETDKGIARYTGPKGELIINYKLPARLITGIQGDHLTIKNRVVATLDTKKEALADDKRFSPYKLQAVLDDQGTIQAYTWAKDGIYVAEPLLGTPMGSLEFSRLVADKKFFESRSPEIVNMRMSDGSPLLFKFLGSFETDRLEYLLEQKADPNMKNWSEGNTALHVCNNIEAAELLLANGADPTIKNAEGKTPFETAPNEEMKNFLDPSKPTPTPTPTSTPTPTPTPGSPSPTPTPTP